MQRIGAQSALRAVLLALDYDDHCANKIDGVHHLRAQFDRHSKSRRGFSPAAGWFYERRTLQNQPFCIRLDTFDDGAGGALTAFHCMGASTFV